jgi:hypothetical protein
MPFPAEERFGPTTPTAVSGIWSVSVALATAILVLIALNRRRLTDLRASVAAGVNASVLSIVSVASLVGFGTVVAALPAFELVREWVLGIEGGPLVSLAVSTNLSHGRRARAALGRFGRWTGPARPWGRQLAAPCLGRRFGPQGRAAGSGRRVGPIRTRP